MDSAQRVIIGNLGQGVAEAVQHEQAAPAGEVQPAIMILRLDRVERGRIDQAGAIEQAIGRDR